MTQAIQNAGTAQKDDRAIRPALMHGFARHCPACGTGALYSGYIQTNDSCPACGLHLEGHQADDAPPYFTIFLAGHIVVPLMLAVEKLVFPPLWVHFVLWLPLTAILCWWLLPRIKGMVIGAQWALRLSGFSDEAAQARKKP